MKWNIKISLLVRIPFLIRKFYHKPYETVYQKARNNERRKFSNYFVYIFSCQCGSLHEIVSSFLTVLINLSWLNCFISDVLFVSDDIYNGIISVQTIFQHFLFPAFQIQKWISIVQIKNKYDPLRIFIKLLSYFCVIIIPWYIKEINANDPIFNFHFLNTIINTYSCNVSLYKFSFTIPFD